MKQVHGKDTLPERIIRSFVHRSGFRYRLHENDLPGKPDLVFRRMKKVIFVHGCFWHGHQCKRGCRKPKTNVSYWENKINRNVQRDSKNQFDLNILGWKFFIVWECELKSFDDLAKRIIMFLKQT